MVDRAFLQDPFLQRRCDMAGCSADSRQNIVSGLSLWGFQESRLILLGPWKEWIEDCLERAGFCQNVLASLHTRDFCEPD
jgi:hypothetical protein